MIGKELDVSRVTFYGLFALQHRGQEASGICIFNDKGIFAKKGLGLVSQIYKEDDIENLKGYVAIGHNRYSTSHSDAPAEEQIQPYVCKNNRLAVAHNGNLPCTEKLKDFLQNKGIDTSGYNDSRMIHSAIEYYMNNGDKAEDAIIKSYPLFTGAFSLLVMTDSMLIGVRDQYGMRPLSVGILDGGYAFASETCALNTIGAKVNWEVAPGEMIVCDTNGSKNVQITNPKNKFDIFEFVYFARPDSRHLTLILRLVV